MGELTLTTKIFNFVVPMYKDAGPLIRRLEYLDKAVFPEEVDVETLKVAALLVDVVREHESEVRFFLGSVGLNKKEVDELISWLILTRIRPQDSMGEILDSLRKNFPVELVDMD